MRTRIQAQQALTGYTRRHAKRIVEGDLGNNAGVVDHPTRTNYVYVHLHGDDNQIIEAEAVASFPHTAGIIVAVEELKRTGSSRWQVLGIASNILYPSSIWAGTVGEHASQHQRRDLGQGGFDPLDIYNRALVNLRARAQATPDMTLYVQRGFYFIGGALFEWTGGNSGAFTAPASSPFLTIRRCDLLYIGSDNALHIVTGATTSDGSLPPYPVTPTTCIPIAYVYLTSNTTIIEETAIKDARVILTASDATAAAHNLLSAIHGDTLAASVVDGDIIIGNVTPKWSRLAISVPAANVRNVLGVDNGELRPSWKAIFDSTNPAALGVASPGTELTAAHRGHVHPTTNLALLNASNTFTQNQTIWKVAPQLNLLNTTTGLITEVTYSQINAPDAAGGSGNPGSTYTVIGGIGDGAGPGGDAALQGGNGGATGAGGSVSGTGGSGGATSGPGGNCTFNGGGAVNGDSDGGSVIFNVGLKSGAGVNGLLKFGTGGADFAIMGIGGISGGDKTFTFPNVTGIFALGAGTITNATTNDVTVAAHTHAVSGTFAATAHDLFSTTHGDTTGAASPVDGDLIIGNVTPKWSKLAISIPAAGTLNYLGVNNGELRPSWKSASSNPGAAAAALQSDASGNLHLQNLTLDAALNFGTYIDLPGIANPAAPAAGHVRFHALTTQGFTRFEQDNEATTNITIGRDNVFIAKNTTGSPIAAGKPVYVTGATGNVPNIALAKADAIATLPAVGLTLDTIGANNFGQVMASGIITGQDTSAFLVGDQLWVDPANAGGLVKVRPVYPNIVQRVGSVLVSNLAIGAILVTVAPFLGGLESGTTATTWTGAGALHLAGTSNQVVLQSAGVTGTLTWTPATSNKVITLPNLTGNMALGAGTATVSSTNDVTVASHTHAVTSSAAPGAAASLLATDASGNTAVQAISTGSSATKWGSGTAFPASSAGDRFFRTDLGWLCYNDGTRWLTDYEFSANLLQLGLAANTSTVYSSLRLDYVPYITRIAAISRAAATNDGSKYWTITVRTMNVDQSASTTIDSFTTAADTAATWTSHEHVPSATSVPLAANAYLINILAVKTSTPGNLDLFANVYYRLIVT